MDDSTRSRGVSALTIFFETKMCSAHSHQSFCDLKFQFSDSSISTSLFTWHTKSPVSLGASLAVAWSTVYLPRKVQQWAQLAAQQAQQGWGAQKKKLVPTPWGATLY